MSSNIDRKKFLKVGALGLGAGLLPLTWSCSNDLRDIMSRIPNGKRPNILWISTEDLSGSRLGCYGDPVAQTPNIDALAAQGVRFADAHVTSPVCSPCRSGIITGMYPTSIGTHHMRTSHRGEGLPTPYEAVPPPYVKGFPEYLRANGYYCTNNSKTDYQFGNPITIWDESSRTAHWRNRTDPDQPFFAVFNLMTTHESRMFGRGGGAFGGGGRTTGAAPPGGQQGGAPQGFNTSIPQMGSQIEAEPAATDTDPNIVPVPAYYPDTPAVRDILALMYDQIALHDTEVGQILAELEEDGLAEDTIVFYWTDHGGPLPREKRNIYDCGTHIGLVIRWPGVIDPGSVANDPVSSIDLGPMVLAMAGVPVPIHMQGRPMLGLQGSEPREYIFVHRDRFDESYDMVRSVKSNDFTYIRNYYPNQPYMIWVPYRNRSPIMQEMLRLDAAGELEGAPANWFQEPRPPEELYDRKADPYNVNNLADDPKYEKVLERMRAVMDQWQEDTDDMGFMSEETMVAMWYPDGVQPKTNTPKFIPNSPTNRASSALESPAEIEGPANVDLYCATEGASIAYTFEEEENPHWLLYYAPIKLPQGKSTLRARAIRYGYQESDEAVLEVTVTS